MAKVTRKKSLNELERQYVRIMNNPNASQARKTAAYNALQRYNANIQKTATYKRDGEEFNRAVGRVDMTNSRSIIRGMNMYLKSPVTNRGYSTRVYRDGLISG